MDSRPFWRGREAWGWRGGEVRPIERAAAARLDRALRRLETLAARSPFEVAVGGGTAERTVCLSCTVSPPASLDAVAEAELRLGTALPADYVRFLRFSDGAVLYHAVDGTGGFDGAELFGTAALVRHAEERACDYHAQCIPELVIFGAVDSAGDSLAFETGRTNPYGGCAVLDARPDFRPDQWWVIAPDFTSWLTAALREVTYPRTFGRLWTEDEDEQLQLPLSDGDVMM